MLFPTLGPSSLPVVVAQPKDMQTEQLLCWSGMTDTEHTTTSGSNEEEVEVSEIGRHHARAQNAIASANFLESISQLSYKISGSRLA